MDRRLPGGVELHRGQLSCESFLPGSPENVNFAQFCDRKVGAKFERAEALQTTDPYAAGRLWARIDGMIVDRAPWVPLLNPKTSVFVSERLGNY